jgi:hypothetical protein
MRPAAFPLPADWGEAWLEPAPAGRGDRAAVRCDAAEPGTARAYDHRGAALIWRPGQACRTERAFACDLEHVARFAGAADPAAVDDRLRIESWVASEVVAKLLRDPVLAFVKRFGLVPLERGAPVVVDLRRFGRDGAARILIRASADGAHVAGFGLLDEASAAGA